MDRRELLHGALAFAAAQIAPRAPASGTIAPARACVADAGIVDWRPDVLHPVSFGFREYGPDEAPVRLRVFYPSHQPFTEGGATARPLLKMCDVRWPLVLFLHGRPPCDGTQPNPNPDYFRRWTRIPAALAKSGYVVVVPQRDAVLPNSADDPAIAQAIRLLDWARDVRVAHPGAARVRVPRPALFGWEDAEFVDPQRTAVVGHSWGGLLAARVAAARPSISSYVGLGAGFREIDLSVLTDIPCPKFFMWADDVFQEDLETLWEDIPRPKHSAVFPGQHFDYLAPTPGCSAPRGACPMIGDVAADLAALFIARNTPVAGASAGVPASLEPPDVTLTPRQLFFAGDNLSGLRRFATLTGCNMTLRWETPRESSSRELGQGRRRPRVTR